MSSKLEITLIRHGETEWSLSGRHTGTTDLELTPNGITQAKELKNRFDEKAFNHIFCSPLKRAVQTATLAGLFPRAEVLPELSEWNYGDFEGLTTEQIRKEKSNWNVFLDGAKNGESPDQVGQRADRVISRIKRLDGTIAIVSSAHFLRSFAARWVGLPVSFGRHLFLSTASVSVLSYEREVPSIKLWNLTQTSLRNSRG